MNCMKISILISLLCLQNPSHAQVVRIPDPNFKQRIIALGYDTNGDNQVQITEAQAVTKLSVDNLGIVNLEGISHFINLEELNCYNNKLSSLDVSKLKKLKSLYAFNNRIENLNINGLTELEYLYIQDNFFIATLDVLKCLKLSELIFSNNKVKHIDVSGLNKLQKIEGDNNQLEDVRLRKAPLLKWISFKNNPVTPTIDIRALTNLEYFNFEGCNLLFINFSGTIKLKEYHW
jgi:protein phosphatase 1 regulatory subunit 7